MSFVASLRRAWAVLLAYGLFAMWGIGCFVASLALSTGGFGLSAGDVGVVIGVLVATAIGHVAGNLLGLTRLRLVVVVGLFAIAFAVTAASGAALGGFALFLVVAVIAALGGYLGIASRLDVVAAWFPLSFAVGGAVIWMNRHGAVATFVGGEKHAVWDPFTILCLAGAVFLMLVFLATRQSLGLTVWQEVGRSRAAAASPGAAARVATARPGRGSLVVLLAFSLVVLGATAAISPYLFRTAPAKAESQAQGKPKPQEAQPKPAPSSGQRKPKPDDDEPFGKPDAGHMSEAAAQALMTGVRILAWLLALALLLLLLLAIFVPPTRRALLLRHLERPLWPVAPTSRVMNLWRRALASLRVLKISPGSDEAPRDFARRAAEELTAAGCEAPGLDRAAAIVERVDYAGRGLGESDEQAMREAVTGFVRAVDAHATVGKKIAAAWGPAPEVEP